MMIRSCSFCQMDTGGNHELGCPMNRADDFTQGPRIPVDKLAEMGDRIELLEKNLDAANKRVEEARKYMQHLKDCEIDSIVMSEDKFEYPGKCTCGLDALLEVKK